MLARSLMRDARALLAELDRVRAWIDAFAGDGEWTPAIVDSAGTATGINHTLQEGLWSRAGGRIFFDLDVAWDSKGSGGGGNAQIAGLTAYKTTHPALFLLRNIAGAATLPAGAIDFFGSVSTGLGPKVALRYNTLTTSSDVLWSALGNSGELVGSGSFRY